MSDQFDQGAEDRGDESVPVERDGKGRFRGSGNPRLVLNRRLEDKFGTWRHPDLQAL